MRIRYEDSMSAQGELDLGDVRAGDLVRFTADFRKIAGPKGVLNIRAGEVGEVTSVGPESLVVRAPGERTAGGDTFGEHVDADLNADDLTLVVVLVDVRDPRIGNGRITKESNMKTATLETWELEQYIGAVAARGVDAMDRGMVIAELVRTARRQDGGDGGYHAANLIAGTTPAAWSTFVLAAGFARRARRTAGHVYDMAAVNMATWAIEAMNHDMGQELGSGMGPGAVGRPKLKLEQRSDVVHALDALIEDVEGGPYKSEDRLSPSGEDLEFEEHVVHDRDQLDDNTFNALADMGGKLRRARDHVRAMDDATWLATLQESVSFTESLKSPSTQRPQLQPQPAPVLEPEEAEEFEDEDEFEDEEPSEAARVPIRWMPEGVTARWVWAEEGKSVFIKSIKEQGVIVGFDPPDGVLVESSSGRGAFDAADVYLHQKATDKPRPEMVPPDELAQWKTDRKRSASCYGVSHGERDSPDGDRATNNPGRAGEARLAGHAGGRAGDSPRMGPRSSEIRWHRSLWDGTVFSLGLPPTRAGDGSGRAGAFDREALGPLGVKEIQRWLTLPDEFAVISAYRKRPKSVNQEAHGQLMAELQRRGYSPSQIRPLRGQYFGEDKDERGEVMKDESGAPVSKMVAEQSVLVLGMSFEDAMEVGKAMDQDSIIYKGKEGVVGAYYTDGSGRVNLAVQGDEPAVGEAAAKVRVREKKPEKRGPPSPADPWSKARNVGFEFPIDWDKTFAHPGGRPLTLEEAREQTRKPKAPLEPAEPTPL